MPKSLELVQGTLELMILKTVSRGPAHGYQIAAGIGNRTESALMVDEGALYPSLHRLEARGYLSSAWGVSENNRKAKYYLLTAKGRKRLDSSLAYWRNYVTAVDQVLRDAEA